MRTRVLGLVAALGAAAVLLALPARDAPEPPRAALTRAQRATMTGNLPDGPAFAPGLFLDARTAIGTAPTPDARSLRLVQRSADGSVRELRRRSLEGNPVFDAFAADGETVVWTETFAPGRTEIWAAGVSGRSRLAHRLTADTGNFLGYDSQYDLVIAEGKVHWAAAAPGGARRTEIRSVALTGGKVSVRVEDGLWALSAWPWLVDEPADASGTTRLRNPATSREIEVALTGAELATCSPVWCRVQVITDSDLARIDAMRPDGSDRRRMAGGDATAAIGDVAVLDRFEILAESRPDSDLTGTSALLVHDLEENTTVELAPAVDGAFSRGGVLWWATGDLDSTTWHTLDLRSVA